MRFGLFFVEDEIGIRENIRHSINWEDTDFEYLGDASDGEAALPQILELMPDIVVTDIKMPFMDGLELCRCLKKERPETEILILSGYDEFAYAQRAISLGVSEYLLKPITPVKLMQTLNKAALKLSAAKESALALERLRSGYSETEVVLSERFLYGLVTGSVPVPEAYEKAPAFGYDLRAKGYMIVVARSSAQADRQALGELLREQRHATFMIGYHECGAILFGDEAGLLEAAKQLSSALAALYGQGISLGIGRIVGRISELGESYRDAEGCIRILTAQTDAGFNKDALDSRAVAELMPGQRKLGEFLRVGLVSEIPAFLSDYLSEGDAGKSFLYSLYALTQLNFTVREFVAEWGDAFPEADEMVSMRQASDVRTQCERLLRTALECRDSSRGSRYSDVVGDIKRYVADNFSKGEINLEELARTAKLSAGHMASVFKKETGSTITEYITKVRIASAKELLRATHLRTAEISDHVGYGDPNYFSTIFKKQTGQTPREYRNQK
jgi:two-component system response regulator YesN